MHVKDYYYSGGFAEIVSHPSLLTYSFFKEWFSGDGSLGKAMGLLQLPYIKNTHPILELNNGDLLLNLRVEQETLYKHTIFAYQSQQNTNSLPCLGVKKNKVLSPLNWQGTIQILLTQSRWIANPKLALEKARKLIEMIPEPESATDMEMLDRLLKESVWPNVIAVGLVSEFYTQFLQNETKENFSSVQSFISHKAAQRDWYFLSLADQGKVKRGEMSFAEYLDNYGIRADKDYELTSPRWHEIPEIIRERIERGANTEEKNSDEKEFVFSSEKIRSFADVSIEFQLLRSEAKKKTLHSIDLLRQAILHDFCNDSCSHGENCNVVKKVKKGVTAHPTESTHFLIDPELQGKGMGISQGRASGVVKHISDTTMQIQSGTIGIFPNASPEFSFLYSKCAGMIFLRGGSTSHGATVAREYRIPALIDEKASTLPDGVHVTIDGEEGSWNLSKDDDNRQKEEKQSEDQSYKSFFTSFSEIDPTTVNIVGGKAAALSRLSQLGLPVPEGFVITVEAFKEFHTTELPKGFQEALMQKMDESDLTVVAVRSSAIAEDSDAASWAGQLESYLNVSKEDVLKKIQECWASINSKRAEEYAKQQKVSKDKLVVAVIVQKMIASEVSGVTFTENPVTKNTDEIVVEAAFGLGDTVVQGTIVPSRYIFTKEDLSLKSSDPHGKEPLSEEQQRELLQLSISIERHFSRPQDIEWAIADGKIYVLQSRPITTI